MITFKPEKKLSPKETVLAITMIFPNARIGKDIIVEVLHNEVSLIKAPRFITPKEFDDVLPKVAEKIEDIESNRNSITADKWIEQQGFTALKVVALMDLEGKLAATNKTSAKLTEVRRWLDDITATYSMCPVPRKDWPAAPFRFEETVQEALSTITP